MQLFDELISRFETESILGYEPITNSSEELESLLRTNKLNDDIRLLLSDEVGSFIGVWGLDENSPIVYLNSEGSPYAVIANNFREFLSLLYYGSYGPLQADSYFSYLAAKKRFERRGAEFTRPEPSGPGKDELNEIQDRLRSEFETYNDVVNWLESNDIAQVDPFELTKSAFENHKNIEDLISSVQD